MVHFTQYHSCSLFYSAISGNRISPVGLPHSAIRASMNMCFSTRLFAAYHGLLRLTAPQASTINLYSLDHIIFPSVSTCAFCTLSDQALYFLLAFNRFVSFYLLHTETFFKIPILTFPSLCISNNFLILPFKE